jgi:AbrB family looped-hinge helix DNA binding protein
MGGKGLWTIARSAIELHGTVSRDSDAQEWYRSDSVVCSSIGGTMVLMVESFLTFKTDAKGRTVIPAVLREQAGIREGGDVLVGYVEEGRLVIETRAAIRRRVRAQAAATGASGVVDGLFADRRADLEREERDRPGREA